jgi:predicted NUDIX family NTP pyrophosphohydrolase
MPSPATLHRTAPLTVPRSELESPQLEKRGRTFPEVDRAEWFTPPIARKKILEGQQRLIDRLEELVSQ